MSNFKRWLLNTITTIVIVVLVFFLFGKDGSQQPLDNSKVDSLITIIDSNNKKFDYYDSLTLRSNRNVIVIDSQFTIINKKIDKFKNEIKKKNDVVDSFSNDSLYKSITKRYNK